MAAPRSSPAKPGSSCRRCRRAACRWRGSPISPRWTSCRTASSAPAASTAATSAMLLAETECDFRSSAASTGHRRGDPRQDAGPRGVVVGAVRDPGDRMGGSDSACVTEAAQARIEFRGIRSAVWNHPDGPRRRLRPRRRWCMRRRAETAPRGGLRSPRRVSSPRALPALAANKPPVPEPKPAAAEAPADTAARLIRPPAAAGQGSPACRRKRASFTAPPIRCSACHRPRPGCCRRWTLISAPAAASMPMSAIRLRAPPFQRGSFDGVEAGAGAGATRRPGLRRRWSAASSQDGLGVEPMNAAAASVPAGGACRRPGGAARDRPLSPDGKGGRRRTRRRPPTPSSRRRNGTTAPRSTTSASSISRARSGHARPAEGGRAVRQGRGAGAAPTRICARPALCRRRRRRSGRAGRTSMRLGKAAKAGHADAEVEYGIRPFSGTGTARVRGRRRDLLRRAALSGNPIGQNRYARGRAAVGAGDEGPGSRRRNGT